MGPCILAGMLFLAPCAHAAPFAEAARSAPVEHRALAASVAFIPGNIGWAYPDGRIQLPETTDTWPLLHEIGHLVGWTKPHGQQLIALWRAEFSPSDAPTAYGHTSMYEDFAESYELAVVGKLGAIDARRNTWMVREALGGR